jgi:hypothetical protein
MGGRAMEIRGQIHVLKSDMGKEDEGWAYLVSFFPSQGVGPAQSAISTLR